MTKVDIISGFLGAGKTTLISKLLKEALKGEQVVLIENEFGEIGIDGGFLKDSGVEIREMNSGCICCSLVGDFGTSLKEVVDKYHPDRIIIEPSGVGKLSDVIKAVKDLHIENEIVLNSASTVADASKVKVYMKNFGEFFNNQIEHAGTVILSRTQNVSEEKLKTAIELIKSVNPNAHIITTPWDDIDGKQILDAMENFTNLELEMLAEAAAKVAEEHEHHHHHDDECGCGHDHHDEEHEHHHHDGECGCGHHHHHADEVFNSIGFDTVKKYNEVELSDILKKKMTKIQIIILSGYGEFDYAKEAIKIGVTDYLTKPVTGEQLLEALNKVKQKLDKKKRQEEDIKKLQKNIKTQMKNMRAFISTAL